jgi:hypothetical protein
MKYNLRKSVRLVASQSKLDLSYLILLMIMLVGLIDGIPFKMLKIWSFYFLNGISKSFAVNYINDGVSTLQKGKRGNGMRIVRGSFRPCLGQIS